MDGVLVTSGCCDPLHRGAARVSMGTVFKIPWTRIDLSWPDAALKKLRSFGFKTAALALNDDSIPIDDPILMREGRLAILLGTEGDGLTQDAVEGCDYTVRIPMSHGVNSLNVAAASAVAFWQLRQNPSGQDS